MDMTNETVGDAISDLLLVETILHAKGWSVQDWNKSYQVTFLRLDFSSKFKG
jgi:phosphoacetylglucosamine mutase